MSTGERAFSAVFGALLLRVGLYALVLGPASLPWRIGGELGLAVLGGTRLYAAYHSRPSRLSRIGPLP